MTSYSTKKFLRHFYVLSRSHSVELFIYKLLFNTRAPHSWLSTSSATSQERKRKRSRSFASFLSGLPIFSLIFHSPFQLVLSFHFWTMLVTTGPLLRTRYRYFKKMYWFDSVKRYKFGSFIWIIKRVQFLKLYDTSTLGNNRSQIPLYFKIY